MPNGKPQTYIDRLVATQVSIQSAQEMLEEWATRNGWFMKELCFYTVKEQKSDNYCLRIGGDQILYLQKYNYLDAQYATIATCDLTDVTVDKGNVYCNNQVFI